MSQDTASDRKGKARAVSLGTDTPGPKDLPSPKRKSIKYSEFAPSESSGPSRPRSPPAVVDLAEDDDDPLAGLTEEEILKLATRPDEVEGVADWGIPPAVNPDEASDTLKVNLKNDCATVAY